MKNLREKQTTGEGKKGREIVDWVPSFTKFFNSLVTYSFLVSKQALLGEM